MRLVLVENEPFQHVRLACSRLTSQISKAPANCGIQRYTQSLSLKVVSRRAYMMGADLARLRLRFPVLSFNLWLELLVSVYIVKR